MVWLKYGLGFEIELIFVLKIVFWNKIFVLLIINEWVKEGIEVLKMCCNKLYKVWIYIMMKNIF